MTQPSPPSASFQTQRLLQHTPQAVFQAFESAELLAQWWGPSGFTNTFSSFEFRPGGAWQFTMHGPDGTDYPNQSIFRELVPGQRVVIEHINAPRFTLTATLQAEGKATLLHWLQTFESTEVAKAVGHIVEPANEQNLDRLAALLARVSASPV